MIVMVFEKCENENVGNPIVKLSDRQSLGLVRS